MASPFSLADILGTLLLFLPPWFAATVGFIFVFMMVIALLRAVAFIMDVLPVV